MSDAINDPVVELGGAKYMRDARGALIPIEQVKTAEKLEDEMVRKVMTFARDLSDQIARFRGHTFEDLSGFQSLLEQEYGADAKKGGRKGNVTFQSYDGCMKVQVAIADQITFGPSLATAKQMIDACLIEWGGESRPEIRALVNSAFAVERGQINRTGIFSLLRLDIDDARWLSAMQALRDAIRITGTKAYVRFYERATADAAWSAVTIDLAAA